MREAVGLLQAASKGQSVQPGQHVPDLAGLTKASLGEFNYELGVLSPPGSAAAEAIKKSGPTHASVMAGLAKAIAICLAEKKAADDKFQKYTEVVKSY